ncbi:MAG: Holliday junction branch migration protein RuvA [Bacteroidota bacterium]|jgi:Holliday junction DNA helicase RuvA
MIHHLYGRLVEKNPAYCVIECAGVGYFVNISLHTFSQLDDTENARLLTYLHVTEDAHTLFGFHEEEERRLFRSLITVSGIGCNTARMMLSSMNPTEIEACIAAEDVARLRKIKGIGEKTAQRVILELRGKLKREDAVPGQISGLKVKDEARNALLTLGFQRNTIDSTLEKLLRSEPGMTVEDLIRQALKSL